MVKGILFVLCFCFGTCCAVFAGSGEWSEAKSDHFIVYFKKAPEAFIRAVLNKAEDHYRETTTSLGFTRYKGWISDDRVKIYIYDDVEDYQRFGYGWSSGMVQTEARLIQTYPAAHGFFDSTLPHELGHIIFRDFVGRDARVPLWMEEGVAMLQEEAKSWGADAVVRQAIKEGRFISLEALMSINLTRRSDRGSVELFYAEAASLANFLVTEGEMYRFSRLCRELKDGRRFDVALNKAYMKYRDIGDLEKAWRKYLDR